MNQHPRALVTGAARRIGACISQHLHAAGYDIILHYRESVAEAEQLCAELNTRRANSCTCLQADLEQMEAVEQMAATVTASGGLHLLVNNASSFYPTPIGAATQQDWDTLINSNLRAPFFLTQALQPLLQASQGAVVNLVDVHAERGLAGFPVYSIAKAGLQMMTRTLARELAPRIRVNGIAPGPILWPEAEAALSDDARKAVLDKTLLARTGRPEDIADAVLFLARAGYVTGQILAVDGGRSLYS
ncbi:MAG: pteridine reductase [Oceanospirillales bacterium]|uniref:Pteridine reductase n=1 Tax=Marinobacterium halophilum TaxID=267374 RepID=A0A2P8EN35_9GAMM|nr:pteridine reductase [Marinobacterium halophilum]MBR9829096.1 pteridine reductase [Oceanospirillales bacterium]PSL10862.1 pteridine reductase [Marinobacterium halophilum]